MSAPSLSDKETAAAIRKLLKANFPATKFSVTTSRGSMCSSVNVRWTDGPSVALVESFTGPFVAGRFDGMTDSYDYAKDRYVMIDGTLYSPSTRYIFTTRTLSAAFANRLIPQIAAYWGGIDNPPVAIDGYFGFSLPEGVDIHQPARADLHGPHYSWFAMIHRAAEDRTEFTRVTTEV